MKIALVYDHVNKIGGAEKILQALHDLYPEAPLYTAVYNAPTASWASGFDVRPTFMQHFPFARRNHEWFPLVPLFAFQTLDFSEFDIVISVTSAFAKAIITPPSTLHICYCLTPIRYLWSNRDDYFQNQWIRALSLPFTSALRLADYYTSNGADEMIAISQHVARRIEKYYRRTSSVIYPPVDVQKFTLGNEEREDFYLIVSRLVDYKRIDIAIAACNKLGKRLKIIGVGKAYDKLKKISGPTIEFLGYLTDENLVGYYQTCRALLYTQEEDFGITAVEALACGTAVIGYENGGVREVVESGKTGELFADQTIDSLVDAIARFEKNVYNKSSCREKAEAFAKERFMSAFSQTVLTKWRRFSAKKI